MKLPLYCFSVFILLSSVLAQKIPPPIEQCRNEPVRYTGKADTDKHYYDGRLRHAVGIHSRQVFRANRAHPAEEGLVGWTYNHAPMLCYWNGHFYVQYLSNLKEEHNPPGRTLLITSKDGVNWSYPQVLFPIYPLPEITSDRGHIAAGTPAVTHQRMGFYVAPDGRLLTLSFVSYCETPRDGPNRGQGLGRLVREIYRDGTFGSIYFIRYNEPAGWNEQNVPNYPFYKKSRDTGFIKACDDLLADKLVTLQWWEMDRTKDGFYRLDPGDQEIKALSYYHRPDNVVVALWKANLSALSPDNGLSWTPVTKIPSLKTCAAKLWGQRMDDGRYSIVYNHSASLRNRFPQVIITGEDGYIFDNMLCTNGEVPPMRYQGIHKNIGTQYIRGIVEGNGNPPGNDVWITYSMNKEDIWVSRIHVPVTGTVTEPVDQNFEGLANAAELAYWNFYLPQWAPVSVAPDPLNDKNQCLMLKDEEPYDYARAERAFPESKKVEIEFDCLMEKVGPAKLEIEVQDSAGNRPMRLRLDEDWLMMDRGKEEPRPVPVQEGNWNHIKMVLDCPSQSYHLYLNGVMVKKNLEFAERVESLERIEFRTGPWRGDVRMFILDGEPGNPGLYQEDLPGSGQKTAASIFYIDNIKTYH